VRRRRRPRARAAPRPDRGTPETRARSRIAERDGIVACRRRVASSLPHPRIARQNACARRACDAIIDSPASLELEVATEPMTCHLNLSKAARSGHAVRGAGRAFGIQGQDMRFSTPACAGDVATT